MDGQFLDRQTDRQTDRQHNYDLLRIVSTVAVIFIHTNWLYFKPLYENPQTSFTWISLALINIITRFSVPAFVMLSGAFILSNERHADAVGFYKKSLKKIFLPTGLVIVFLIIIQICINGIEHNGLLHDLKSVFKGGFYNLWYIYMLVGLYFLTPFIVRMKKVINWSHYKLLAVVMMLWAIISQATSEEKLAYSIGVCFAFLSYYLLGDVLKTGIEKGCCKPKKWILVVILIVCILVSFIWRTMGHNYYIAKAYINFFSPAMVVYAVCIFILFGMMKVNKDCSKLAGVTFEIYLFHMLILRGLAPAIQNTEIAPFVGEILIVAGTFLFSWVVAIGYKRLWKWIIEKDSVNKFIDNLRLWKLFL